MHIAVFEARFNAEGVTHGMRNYCQLYYLFITKVLCDKDSLCNWFDKFLSAEETEKALGENGKEVYNTSHPMACGMGTKGYTAI